MLRFWAAKASLEPNVQIGKTILDRRQENVYNVSRQAKPLRPFKTLWDAIFVAAAKTAPVCSRKLVRFRQELWSRRLQRSNGVWYVHSAPSEPTHDAGRCVSWKHKNCAKCKLFSFSFVIVNSYCAIIIVLLSAPSFVKVDESYSAFKFESAVRSVERFFERELSFYCNSTKDRSVFPRAPMI